MLISDKNKKIKMFTSESPRLSLSLPLPFPHLLLVTSSRSFLPLCLSSLLPLKLLCFFLTRPSDEDVYKIRIFLLAVNNYCAF